MDKLECTCIDAYKIRNMRDSNCCACSCDYNDLVGQLEKANERVAELEDENLTLLNTMAQYPDFFTEKDRQALNKFAIEQQELVIDAAIHLELMENSAHSCNLLREQLRKEQEK